VRLHRGTAHSIGLVSKFERVFGAVRSTPDIVSSSSFALGHAGDTEVSKRRAENVEYVTAYVKDSDFEGYMLDYVPEQNHHMTMQNQHRVVEARPPVVALSSETARNLGTTKATQNEAAADGGNVVMQSSRSYSLLLPTSVDHVFEPPLEERDVPESQLVVREDTASGNTTVSNPHQELQHSQPPHLLNFAGAGRGEGGGGGRGYNGGGELSSAQSVLSRDHTSGHEQRKTGWQESMASRESIKRMLDQRIVSRGHHMRVLSDANRAMNGIHNEGVDAFDALVYTDAAAAAVLAVAPEYGLSDVTNDIDCFGVSASESQYDSTVDIHSTLAQTRDLFANPPHPPTHPTHPSLSLCLAALAKKNWDQFVPESLRNYSYDDALHSHGPSALGKQGADGGEEEEGHEGDSQRQQQMTSEIKFAIDQLELVLSVPCAFDHCFLRLALNSETPNAKRQTPNARARARALSL
jgi:hypothetical protein